MSENAVTERMIALPGGHYAMGSADFYPGKGPVHTVEVAAFELDRVPITNLQRVIAEGVKVDGAARLRDLSAGDVQRLRRPAQAAQDSRGNVDPAGLHRAGSPYVRTSLSGRSVTRRPEPSVTDPENGPPQRPVATAGASDKSMCSWPYRRHRGS